MSMCNRDVMMCTRHSNKHRQCIAEMASMDGNKIRACNEHK
jgi:hypothetical protein